MQAITTTIIKLSEEEKEKLTDVVALLWEICGSFEECDICPLANYCKTYQDFPARFEYGANSLKEYCEVLKNH